MTDDYKIEYCGTCGRQKLPLFNLTLFCPNDCDRIPSYIDTEKTEPINSDICPKCNSRDIGPFNLWGTQRQHCIDCGHVW